jgi:GNAT superfamily N-acetyltransferase
LPYELKWKEFELSTDRKRLQPEIIHGFLKKSYWAAGRSKEVMLRSIEHSLPFGIFFHERQVGFARVVTDYSTFAWIADVFVDEEFRGRGLSKWLMQSILAHPELQRLRRWVLATRDAHELYSRFGFKPLQSPDRWMEIYDPTSES